MKAAVLRVVGAEVGIEEVVLDDLGPHEVRLRTVVTGLCHSDLHFVEGKRSRPMPVIMGHEASAVVEAVGAAVTRVVPGDHVVVFCAQSCGLCAECVRGKSHLCVNPPKERPAGAPARLRVGDQEIHTMDGLGTYAEEMVVFETSVVRIRKDVPLEAAALVSCAVMTGFGAAALTAGVRIGQDVAVVGVGGVGLNAVQGARHAGAQRIIAVDRQPENLKLALQLGATDVVNAAEEDPVAAVRELTGGGVDHALEAVGLPATVQQAYGMLRPGGTVTVVGILPSGATVEIPADEFLREKRIQGAHMGSARMDFHIPMLLDLYMSGRLVLDSLVAERYSLAEINRGFDSLRSGRVARGVITF